MNYGINALLNDGYIAHYQANSLEDCIIKIDDLLKDEYSELKRGNILQIYIFREDDVNENK